MQNVIMKSEVLAGSEIEASPPAKTDRNHSKVITFQNVLHLHGISQELTNQAQGAVDKAFFENVDMINKYRQKMSQGES